MGEAARDPRLRTAPGEDPLLGVVLEGAYRIERRLAEGTTATVYAATHERVPRALVAKVLARRHLGNDALGVRFTEEARVLARIESAHVMRVLDLVETPDGRPAIIAEHLSGESLDAHLARVREVSVPFAVRVIREVCAGLEAAHAAGVVHRDLKPANVFLVTESDGRLRVKLLDFGIARAVKPGRAEPARVAGTPAYMAPEQARGEVTVDARADVYAAGALLYRLLAGRSPYAGADALTVLHRLRTEPPPSLRMLAPGVPDALATAIESAMARDRELRPRSAAQFAAMLAPFDASEAPRGGPIDVTGVRTRRAEDPTVVLPAGAVDASQRTQRTMHRLHGRVRLMSGLIAAGSGIASLHLATGLGMGRVPVSLAAGAAFAATLLALLRRAGASARRRGALEHDEAALRRAIHVATVGLGAAALVRAAVAPFLTLEGAHRFDLGAVLLPVFAAFAVLTLAFARGAATRPAGAASAPRARRPR